MVETRKIQISIGIGIFLITLSICGFTSGGHVYVRDGAAMYLMACSIIDQQWIDVKQHPNTVGGKIGEDGRYYMPFGFLQPVLTTPLIFFGRILAESFNTQYLSFFAATWFNWIITSLLAVTLWRCSVLLGLNSLTAIFPGFAIVFSTPFWVYSQTFFSEPLAALISLLAWLFVYKAKSHDKNLLNLTIAGVLCGIITWLRPLGGILIPALFIYLLLSEKRRSKSIAYIQLLKRSASFLIPACIGITGYLFYNYLRFGHILETGYDLLPDGTPRSFTLDPVYGLKILLLSPGKSIFVFAPLLLLLPLGLILLWKARRKPETIFIVLTGAIYLTVLSSWARVEGGVTWGPRLFLPAIPILFLGLVPLFNLRNRVIRVLLICLMVSGIFIQSAGIIVNFSTIIYQHIDEYFSPQNGVYVYSFNPFPAHINQIISVMSKPEPIQKKTPANATWNRNTDQINPMDGLDLWWLQFWSDGVPNKLITT
ncbi:hypothetical protein K8T06_02670 [bacterium]|nr:hypothetical protein [bacterium]